MLLRAKTKNMKRILFLTAVFLFIGFSDTNARNLWAYLTYSTFNSPEGPYVETYLTVAGKSVKFIPTEDGKYQASVNIIMIFKQGEEIKAFKKYRLNSPEVPDTTKVDFNFVDQQRFQLENGTYSFEIQLADANMEAKAVPYTQEVKVDFPSDKASISGIELVKSYKFTEEQTILTKSGRDLVPYVFTFYPEQENELTFYGEIYNLDKVLGEGQKYLISCYLETAETGYKLNDFTIIRKETAKPVHVMLYSMDIRKLASGNYNLVVEARNQNNEVVASNEMFIQRSNPNITLTLAEYTSLSTANTFVDAMTNIDTLKEYIRSTRPISGGIENQFVKEYLQSADLKLLQQYFLGFWQQRDPVSPEKAWQAYNQEVKKVQYNFGSKHMKGYDTDRGRVYLEYGPPNVRSTAYNEPNTYPYEIWHYYSMQNQRNKKFVFYSEDMVTADFTLLHSDAIGEVNYPQWQVFLRNKVYAPLDMQQSQVINVWGDYTKEYWDLPN
jgi:GWxTD domain-containing protein